MDETPDGGSDAKNYPDHFKIRHYMSQHKISLAARGLYATLTSHCDDYIFRNIRRTTILKECGMSDLRTIKKPETELVEHGLLEIISLGGNRVTYRPTRKMDEVSQRTQVGKITSSTWEKLPAESVIDAPTWEKTPPPPSKNYDLHLIEYKKNMNATPDACPFESLPEAQKYLPTITDSIRKTWIKRYGKDQAVEMFEDVILMELPSWEANSPKTFNRIKNWGGAINNQMKRLAEKANMRASAKDTHAENLKAAQQAYDKLFGRLSNSGAD